MKLSLQSIAFALEDALAFCTTNGSVGSLSSVRGIRSACTAGYIRSKKFEDILARTTVIFRRDSTAVAMVPIR